MPPLSTGRYYDGATMTALAGPFLIVCTILGLGGVAKLVAPLPARQALRALGIPAPIAAVRLLGLSEVALACAAFFSGGPILPMVVGMAYSAFAAFVVLMLRRDAETSCGCFGSAATPPSWLHVVVNLASAGVAFGAIGIDSLATIVGDQPAAGVPLLCLVAVGSYGLYLLLTALPVLFAPPVERVREFSVSRGAPS